MHIVIFGSGGVGGSFGGHLAHSGADVTFIARGAHLAAMQQHGLKIESAKGNFVVNPVQATDDPRSVKQADVILICTKTWQLPGIMGDLKAMAGPDTLIVPLVNSIEATDLLVKEFGSEMVLGGYCYTISYIVAPGVVHSGGKNQIVFGGLDGKPHPRAQQLADIINATGELKGENSADIQSRAWEKFTWISSVSAVGAAVGVCASDWRDVPETKALYDTILRETFAVAEARGALLGEEKFISTRDYVYGLQGTFKPSMQRDMEAGKCSELKEQIGYIVREGERLGVSAPISAAIYAALLPQELAAQKAKN